MKACIVLLLLAANVAFGAAPTATATQSKPNVFGETKSVVQNSNGAPVQTIVAQKPNYAGEIKAVVKNDLGQQVGAITTRPANVFGVETVRGLR